MAKRRNLEIPSTDALRQMEAEFRRETPPRTAIAPIAQVAADAAAVHDPRSPDERARSARDTAEAAEYRQAKEHGLVMLDIPLEEIEADALIRDRVVIDAAELEELKSAIARNGLRLPVEVFATPGGRTPYGLLSGYRRLMAVRALRELHPGAGYDRIRAVLRDPAAMGGTFAAMVEENEIRSGLSPYERGRIAVIAAQQGVFQGIEAAVDALYPVASRAKRSKIRSFALVFEELGDVLAYPDQLREKDGLALAQALREGAEAQLRHGLAHAAPADAAAEAALIRAVLERVAAPPPAATRGGRPRRAPGPEAATDTGFTLRAEEDARGWCIRIGGSRPVDRPLVEDLVRELQRWLDRP